MIPYDICEKINNYFKECINGNTIAVIHDKEFQKKPSVIFINKYNKDGSSRSIRDINDQLQLYFKLKNMRYYIKIKQADLLINNYCHKNDYLDNIDVLWIKEQKYIYET
tara:strand:- start:6639 stop:6965 length:327 start_codon:yes stop_codon:yes gene_type:complete